MSQILSSAAVVIGASWIKFAWFVWMLYSPAFKGQGMSKFKLKLNDSGVGEYN